MIRNKRIVFTILLILFLIFLPNMVKASVEYTRNIYSNNGSMKFMFTGLTLDTTHEYEFGLTKTVAAEVKKWHLITEYTESTAIIDVMTTTTDLRNIINAVDTGYITLRDKTENTVVLQPYSVNLKIPFLNVTNYTVIPNGKDLDANNSNIQVALRCASNSKAYYQYEKITDTNIINKYKEIKSKNGNIMELESMLKTTVPSSNWTFWKYWNGYDVAAGMNGFGYPQRTVSVPENGLYYMWLYFSADNLKNMYGYILVDNLQPEIELESITLPSTKTIELDKILTLTPTFNPSNATNKIVTWSSSDETVATVDNAGKITPKKVGSTIITVISQDGNKKATCTVTVTKSSEESTKKYISFPFVIYNGKSSLSVKNYEGEYKLYYQFVEITDETMKKVEELKSQYKEGKISYSEFFAKYDEIVTKYNDKNWIETKDGKFEIDLSKFTGTKKFVLWAKLVMKDETVYESEIYTMNGSGSATNVSDEQDKVDTKDDTTAKKPLPKTGRVLLVWIALILASSAVIANVRYRKLYK